MSKKKHQPPIPPAALELPIGAEEGTSPAVANGPLIMRLAAGKHAVKAAEVEILVDGARLAGGNDVVEFDLFAETWVQIIVIRDS